MTVAQVRTIIADKYQYDRAVMIADGIAVDYALPNSPVKANSEKVYKDGVLQTDPTHYTINDDLGIVTFVSAPAANVQVVVTCQWSILSDDDITTFETLEGDVKLASAMALDTIASSEALVQKVIRILDLSTDGAAVADSLRAHAKTLREQVTVELEAEGDGAFDWAEQVWDQATLIERLTKTALRE